MTVGVLGGGQLAMMMAQAAKKLDIEIITFDPAANGCASLFGSEQYAFAYDNWEKLEEFANRCDVITYEFENVSLASAEFLQKFKPVLPPIQALSETQDRLKEKTHLNKLGLKTAPFIAIDSVADLEKSAKELGYPFIIKSRFGGYDGKGQWRVHNEADLKEIAETVPLKELIAEGFITFQRELSIVAVRDHKGNCQFFDLAENVHKDGILYFTKNLDKATAGSEAQQKIAEEYIGKIMESFDYTGTMTLELFQDGEELIANEYSPRVHNSGHWSIEGCNISQFEAHIRAVSKIDLPEIKNNGNFMMLNFIGSMPSNRNEFTSEDKWHWHDYKKEARAGRKVGHLTVELDGAVAEEKLKELESVLKY